jgi:SAM-dependent methyltransferase
MNYSEVQVKEILNDIIFNVYGKNPVILLDLWDAGGERTYINHLHLQYETILRDFNTLFSKRDIPPRVLEISSFLGVVDIALAKIGFEAYAYDKPEFQANANLRKLYAEYHVSPSSGRVNDIGKNGLPYPDNFFDAVLLSEVLEHLNFNPLPVLQEINRILKPGGIVYITTPNQANLVHRIKILTGRSIRNSVHDSLTQLDPARNTICGIHWREYTVRELTELLETTGFRPLTSRFTLMTKDIHNPCVKFLYGALGTVFPSLWDSITIIAEKKEYRPVNFWFHEEYIKYLST